MMRAIVAVAILVSAFEVTAQVPDSTEAIARNLLVRRSIHYPQAAEDAGVEGTVLLELTIDRLCTIKNKRVLSGPGYGLDEAALKMIDRNFEEALTRALTPCSPDTLVVPIVFQLE